MWVEGKEGPTRCDCLRWPFLFHTISLTGYGNRRVTEIISPRGSLIPQQNEAAAPTQKLFVSFAGAVFLVQPSVLSKASRLSNASDSGNTFSNFSFSLLL